MLSSNKIKVTKAHNVLQSDKNINITINNTGLIHYEAINYWVHNTLILHVISSAENNDLTRSLVR